MVRCLVSPELPTAKGTGIHVYNIDRTLSSLLSTTSFPGTRGGSRNSLKGGGGFWARILRRGGLGSKSVGIFIY